MDFVERGNPATAHPGSDRRSRDNRGLPVLLAGFALLRCSRQCPRPYGNYTGNPKTIKASPSFPGRLQLQDIRLAGYYETTGQKNLSLTAFGRRRMSRK